MDIGFVILQVIKQIFGYFATFLAEGVLVTLSNEWSK